MLVDPDSDPKLNIYFLGSVILELLAKYDHLELADIQDKVNQKTDQSLTIDYIYLALDWLFIVGAITLNNVRITR